MSRIGSRTAVMQEKPPVGEEFHFPVLSASLDLNPLLFYGAHSSVFRRKNHVFSEKERKTLKKTDNACFDTGWEHPFTTRRGVRSAGMIHPVSGRCFHTVGAGNARHATTTANPT